MQYAYEREVQQGVNVAEAAAAVESLELFIFSALPNAKKHSNGKYTNFYHFDSKVDIVKTVHERFPDLAKRMSLLHLAHYVENWKISRLLAPHKDADGVYVFKRTWGPDFKMPFVVASNDTGPYVNALVDVPPGQNLFAVSEYMSLPDWVKLWGEVLGVKVRYEQLSDDEFFESAPAAFKQEFVDNFHYVEDFGYTGGDPDIKSMEEVRLCLLVGMVRYTNISQLGIDVPLTSMREYFKGEDWSSVL